MPAPDGQAVSEIGSAPGVVDLIINNWKLKFSWKRCAQRGFTFVLPRDHLTAACQTAHEDGLRWKLRLWLRELHCLSHNGFGQRGAAINCLNDVIGSQHHDAAEQIAFLGDTQVCARRNIILKAQPQDHLIETRLRMPVAKKIQQRQLW